ncbi:MAG: PPC domain-containing DNA-binding protein [Vicinamibacteria bacterium]
MKFTVANAPTAKTFLIVFEKEVVVVGGLTEFAREQGLAGGSFFALGALSGARLAYFDREEKRYLPIVVREQVEVMTLVGTIALKDGRPKVHAHAVLGKRDGTALGGHLMEARVWPTLEVVVNVMAPLHRSRDDETGLALIRL